MRKFIVLIIATTLSALSFAQGQNNSGSPQTLSTQEGIIVESFVVSENNGQQGLHGNGIGIDNEKTIIYLVQVIIDFYQTTPGKGEVLNVGQSVQVLVGNNGNAEIIDGSRRWNAHRVTR